MEVMQPAADLGRQMGSAVGELRTAAGRWSALVWISRADLVEATAPGQSSQAGAVGAAAGRGRRGRR